MSSAIVSVSATTAYERRVELAHEGDRRQDTIAASILRDGFAFDWPAILGEESPLSTIEDRIHRDLRSPEFRRTIEAIGVNGELLAVWIQRQHDEETGAQTVAAFAEPPSLATAEQAIAYWRKLLNLTDEEAAAILKRLTAFLADMPALAARAALAIIEPIASLYAQTVEKGMTFADFAKRAKEILPDRSTAILETEYRTQLTRVYGRRREEEMNARPNQFPFRQFMSIGDGRATWYCCAPMGSAGPNGRGYIAASDDPTWIKFRIPCHYRCRSVHSPIGYREAQRLGILAKDGVTKIALIGDDPDRPFGDPPQFAADPTSGKLRRVAPQEGFGG